MISAIITIKYIKYKKGDVVYAPFFGAFNTVCEFVLYFGLMDTYF